MLGLISWSIESMLCIHTSDVACLACGHAALMMLSLGLSRIMSSAHQPTIARHDCCAKLTALERLPHEIMRQP